MVLCPGVEVFEFFDQHGVGVIIQTAFITIRLICASACSVLGLFGSLLYFQLREIGFQVPLVFAVVAPLSFQTKTVRCVTIAPLVVPVSITFTIAMIRVHDVCECQSLIGSVEGYDSPFPYRQQCLRILYCGRLILMALRIVVLELCHHSPVLTSVSPKYEIFRQEFLLCRVLHLFSLRNVVTIGAQYPLNFTCTARRMFAFTDLVTEILRELFPRGPPCMVLCH